MSGDGVELLDEEDDFGDLSADLVGSNYVEDGAAGRSMDETDQGDGGDDFEDFDEQPMMAGRLSP